MNPSMEQEQGLGDPHPAPPFMQGPPDFERPGEPEAEAAQAARAISETLRLARAI